MASNSKIDMHSHFVPPGYRQALLDAGINSPDGMPGIPQWSEDQHVQMMQNLQITKCVLSISSPGTYLKAGDDTGARQLSRYCNEYAADLKRKRPDRFGFFATLPLLDVQGSLEEIAAAFDLLNADGVVMDTNYHGNYLGDKMFDSIFDELNRRNAIVFIHPTTPCLHSGALATPLEHFPRPMLEFFFDTARAVANLFLSGTVARCPNVKFQISHMGGALPPLIDRFASTGPRLIPGVDPSMSPAWVEERLNAQFYFDTAGWSLPRQCRGLLEYVTVDRMLYGSDFPWTPLPVVAALSASHDRYLTELFPNPEDQEKLCRGNATKLLSERKTS